MKNIKTFLLGMKEFRLCMTTHFEYPLSETYDRGRELAHVLTLRYFES